MKFQPISHTSFETTRSKFIQILHHCSVSWKITPLHFFASPFSVMKDNSSVFFYLRPLYFGQKEPVKVRLSDFWVVGWKVTKFLMSCLKLQVSFSLILHHSSVFSVMRDNSSVLFQLNLYMIWTKGAQNFRVSTAHAKFHQTCTLIGSFC